MHLVRTWYLARKRRKGGVGGPGFPILAAGAAGLSFALSTALYGQAGLGVLPSIAEHTQGMERGEGFLALYHDEAEGRVYLELPDSVNQILLIPVVTRGNNIPFRRGDINWWRDAMLVALERSQGRVILVADDLRHRASGAVNPGLERTVTETFPRSVLAVLSPVAQEESRLLVDATELVLTDLLDAPALLAEIGEGSARLDPARAILHREGTQAFADHTILESTLTVELHGGGSGILGETSPWHRAATFGQRLILLRPPEGFRPRHADLRVGFRDDHVWDFDREAAEGYRTFHLAGRWRLEPRDPHAELSVPVRPITVYLEAGIPQAYRDAVRKGVLYWNGALEAAGFLNAIRVEDLPVGADVMSLHHSVVVLWAPHAHAIGNMGFTARDPRTGEALKGVVRLSSSSPLQRFREYAALRAAFASGQPDFDAYLTAHLSWLTAHELGHVLGMTHNNAAASIVSPPGPAFQVNAEGRVTVDLEAIFPPEPHPYDRWVMRYAYTPFPTAETERRGLEAIVSQGLEAGLRQGGDWTVDPGSARGLHGRDALEVLEDARLLRRAALDHFGLAAVEEGEPLGLLFERLVWPYFFPTEDGIFATAAMIGGIDRTWVLHGDGRPRSAVVPAERQGDAVRALVGLLQPRELAIPREVAALVAPTPAYVFRPFELEFPADGPGFRPLPVRARLESSPADGIDELDWARALAEKIVGQGFEPQRLARVAAHHARDPSYPSVEEVMDAFLDGTWGASEARDPAEAALQRVAQRVVLDRLLALADDDGARPEIRAAAVESLVALNEELAQRSLSGAQKASGHVTLARRDIARVLPDPR